MNILPKKSWHVRSRQNIERVKRDEAQAAEEKKRREERAALAEREARTALLREKTRKLTASRDQDGHHLSSDLHHNEHLAVNVISDDCAGSRHVDLFSELSSEKPEGVRNKEHEDEEKAAKEKYEQKIGLLTYLGQSSAEAQTTKPWYYKPRKEVARSESELDKQSCADLKRKAGMDPMAEMEKYLGMKRSKSDLELPVTKSTWTEKGHSHKSFNSGSLAEDTVSSGTLVRQVASETEKQRHRKRKSKHKHKHKQEKERKSTRTKRKKKTKEKMRREESQGPNIQELREERLRREAVARAKTNRLLSGEKPESDQRQESEESINRPGHYNSMFHPELARNRHRPSQSSLV